jgi:IS605 OrfB family transposase
MGPRRALVIPLRAPPSRVTGPVPNPRAEVESSLLPPAVLVAMADFRLLANRCLREAILSAKTARGSISRFSRTAALEAHLNGGFGLTAGEVGLSLAKSYRRASRRGSQSRVPYIRTPFLRAGTTMFHFDPESGKVRLSLRRCEWASFHVEVSNYHRRVLAEPRHRVTQLHLSRRRVVLIYEKVVPDPYVPTAVVALDTNETSLDGVEIGQDVASYVRVLFPQIRRIQSAHFDRRRYLGAKKAHDLRVRRKLLGREGRRERHRVRSRLHDLTRTLIDDLARRHAALVLEDLSRMSTTGRSRATRRRLSSWPRGELHRQLTYKAVDAGVPVYWVNPYRTSRTCPRCGDVCEPRKRVGPRFECAACGWQLDRQLNAGLNLGKIVLREHAELGGLRLGLDALSEEVVRFLYPVDRGRLGTSGAEGEGGMGSTAPAGGRGD